MTAAIHGSTTSYTPGMTGDETNTAADPSVLQQGEGSASGDYIYGFEALFATSQGPISPQELIVWLKAHTSGLNQELSDRMTGADMRAKLMEDLGYLKAQVTEGNGGDELKAEAQRLLEAYADTPYADDLEIALKGILENANDEVSEPEVDLIGGELQTLLDKLGKDDQMDMIYIQTLTDRLNEQFGFASSYSSKYHDTLMAIIGNLAQPELVMDSTIAPGPSWSVPVYEPTETTTAPISNLPPELQLLVAMVKSGAAQNTNNRLSVDEAFERLAELRDQIREALERAKEAQEDAGFWGDVSSFLGGDVATIAGAIAAAALVVGSGGTGAAIVVAAIACGFSVGAEVGEELGLDPKVVMALKVLGAVGALLAGNGVEAAGVWAEVYTAAKVTEGGAIAAGGGAHVAAGQCEAEATEERGQATYLRKKEQLDSALADEIIAAIGKVFEQLEFLTESASSISAERNDLNLSVIKRIGG